MKRSSIFLLLPLLAIALPRAAAQIVEGQDLRTLEKKYVTVMMHQGFGGR
jgi:hypothetical protein